MEQAFAGITAPSLTYLGDPRKRAETTFPRYIVVLCVLTAIYLAIEVPFAAYLVDLLGGEPTQHELERAEHAGRLISGIALALALWSFQVPRMLRRRKSVPMVVLGCLLSGCLVVPLVYFGERSLVDVIAEDSQPSLRQQAARALAARGVLLDRSASFNGLGAAHDAPEDPTWAAFRGLFGFIGLWDERVLERPGGDPVAMVERSIAKSMPGVAVFRTETFLPLLDGYQQGYDAYLEIVAARDQAIAQMKDAIRTGWNEHLDAMQRHGRRYEARAVREVQKRGVDVPDNWSPRDRRTFERAAAEPEIKRINSSYNSAIQRVFGYEAVIPPNLGGHGEAAFFYSDPVQRSMFARLHAGAFKPDWELSENLSADRLAELYRHHVGGLTAAIRKSVIEAPDGIGRWGMFSEFGEEAVRAVIVPVFALGLSLIGAMGHTVKLLNNLVLLVLHARKSRFGISRFLRTHGLIRLPILLGGLGCAAVATYAPANEVVEAPYYRRAMNVIRGELGDTVPQSLEWTISVQQILGPASSAMRTAGLFTPLEMYLDAGVEADVLTAEAPHLQSVPLPRRRPAAVSPGGLPVPLPRPTWR